MQHAKTLTSTQKALCNIADVRKAELMVAGINRERVNSWFDGTIHRILSSDWTCCECGKEEISGERFMEEPFAATCCKNCQEKLNEKRNFLLHTRNEYFGQLEGVENKIKAVIKDRINSMGSHPGEQTATPRNDLYHRQSSLKKLIAQCDNAMRMCDFGNYGICSDCHEKIDPKRLALVPSTSKCTECKNESEKENTYVNCFGGKTHRSRVDYNCPVI